MYPTIGQIVEVSEIEASHLIGNGRAEAETVEKQPVTSTRGGKNTVKSDEK